MNPKYVCPLFLLDTVHHKRKQLLDDAIVISVKAYSLLFAILVRLVKMKVSQGKGFLFYVVVADAFSGLWVKGKDMFKRRKGFKGIQRVDAFKTMTSGISIIKDRIEIQV